jgi:cellulose biosynthesis protein BcsQ
LAIKQRWSLAVVCPAFQHEARGRALLHRPHRSATLNIAHDGARALELMGGLVTPMITSRVDYQIAAVTGQGVTELNPKGKAAEEMRELWASVKRRLGVRKHGKAARVA